MTIPALSSQPPIYARGPVGVDTTRPSIARVYDYSLGGKDNYDVDRAAYMHIEHVAPRYDAVARANRRWLHRVIRHLAGTAGIDQFLDIGAGMPTTLNTHQVAQYENRHARVVYVDNDPLCAVHGSALLVQNENTRYIRGDLLEPGTLLENQEVTSHLDTNRPIGLLVCGLLHHLDDGLDPAAVVRDYTTRLPAGSYLATTNFWDPADEYPELHTLATKLERAFTTSGLGPARFRTRAQQLEYFDGLHLIEPGLTQLDDWWPPGPPTRPRRPAQRLILGGVGYKQPPPPPQIHAH
ncbi:SAM-dependent methyltransferase [Nocardia sp. NPDC051750]|uniref:SAM-dependent methyltransferase n=1 Tax=Nocardia sp. NPDC051750 TaxID=3364325 RepID=UPI00378880AA